VSAPRQLRQLSEVEAAYIAGLIDGEGTVTLSREHRGERRRLVVSIATELELLTYARDLIGVGKITRKATTSEKHRASFAYRITCRQALALLARVQPFLRSYKASRARFALDHYQRLTPRNGKYSPDVSAERTKFEVALLSIIQKDDSNVALPPLPSCDRLKVGEPSRNYGHGRQSCLKPHESAKRRSRKGKRSQPADAHWVIGIRFLREGSVPAMPFK